MSNLLYEEVSINDVNHLFHGELILLVTATELETKYTHAQLKSLDGYDKILKLFEGDLTYYIGKFGNYKVAHVQSSMGSISRSSSIMTVSKALELLKSKIVIMVGIAFGIDESKQNIGDILVSESIIPYNSRRVGKDDIVQRGIEAPASKLLLNRFKNAITTWEHITDENIKVKMITTRLLSGEELVDNLEYRNKLVKTFPDSKGGEMEGAGLYAACSDKIDWIVVKGICDFADGNKGSNKAKRQEIAIKSALSLCANIFDSMNAFKDVGILSINEEEKTSSFSQMQDIDAVLFDIYNIDKESYYIQREKDIYFNSLLKQYGIWIHGVTGCGKSNLIIRNLKQNNCDFIQIGLASCIDNDPLSFFYEMLAEIAAKVDIPLTKMPKKFSDCSKKIVSILKEHYTGKDLIIFIEEIPISTEDDYKNFSEKIFSLILAKNLYPELEKVKFVLSSINCPIKYLRSHQQKIHSLIKFLALTNWDKKDILSLINLIERELNYQLPVEFREKLIEASQNSPRYVKKFFRNLFTRGEKGNGALQLALKETSLELNLYKNV